MQKDTIIMHLTTWKRTKTHTRRQSTNATFQLLFPLSQKKLEKGCQAELADHYLFRARHQQCQL
jgi:hypothetical protein